MGSSLVGVEGRITVHQLFGRERDQVLVAECPLTLNIAHSTEGPARSHRALVLHWADHTSLPPVKLARQICQLTDVSIVPVWTKHWRRRRGHENFRLEL